MHSTESRNRPSRPRYWHPQLRCVLTWALMKALHDAATGRTSGFSTWLHWPGWVRNRDEQICKEASPLPLQPAHKPAHCEPRAPSPSAPTPSSTQGSTNAVMKAVIDGASATPPIMVAVRYWLAAVCVIPWLPCFGSAASDAARPALQHGAALAALWATSFALGTAALQHTSANRATFVFCKALRCRHWQPHAHSDGPAQQIPFSPSAAPALCTRGPARCPISSCSMFCVSLLAVVHARLRWHRPVRAPSTIN